MELHSNQETQPNAQKEVLEPLVKLLMEMTGRTDITLKNNIHAHNQDAGGLPTARVVQKTLKLDGGKIQYHSHAGIYEITNPYISISPDTEFKHTDLNNVPAFMNDSSCVFTKDGMQLRQSYYNGHITRYPVSTTYEEGSKELNFWLLGIVMEITSYIREQVKLGTIDLDFSSESINTFANALAELMYERLGEFENQSNEKLEMDIHARDHLGEIVPAIGVKAHSIEFTLDDAVIQFTRLCNVLKLNDEDSSQFDESFAHSVRQLDNERLKEFLGYLSTKIPVETMEAAVMSFPQETAQTIPHIWGETVMLHFDLSRKQWLIRTITRPEGKVLESGELIYPKTVISSSFTDDANLNSILVLLGLLGYVSPMYSLKAYQG
jgi:hypothetical protein